MTLEKIQQRSGNSSNIVSDVGCGTNLDTVICWDDDPFLIASWSLW